MKNYNRNMFSARLLMSMVIAFMTYGAWAAAKPVAIWHRDFTAGTRGGYGITANGNTVGNEYITIDGTSGGVIVKNTSVTQDLENYPLGVVARFTGAVYSSSIRALATTITSANSAGSDRTWFGVNNSTQMQSYYNSSGSPAAWTGQRNNYDANHAWPNTGTHYFGCTYSAEDKDGSSGRFGWRSYVDGVLSVWNSGMFSYNTDRYLYGYGFAIGGSTTGYQFTDATIDYIAIVRSAYPSDIAYWSLTDMTKTAATFAGSDANTGVNVPASGETISAATAAAAVFVQADATLGFSGSGSLTIGDGTGPLYIDSAATLTIDLNGVTAPTAESPFVLLVKGQVYGAAQVNFINVPSDIITSIGEGGTIALLHNSVYTDLLASWKSNGQKVFAWRTAGSSSFFSSTAKLVDTDTGVIGASTTISAYNDNGGFHDENPAGVLYYDDPAYLSSATVDYAYFTLGGLFVTAGGSSLYHSDQELKLGDNSSNRKTFNYVFAQSFTLGPFNKNKLYGPVNLTIYEGATLTLSPNGLTLAPNSGYDAGKQAHLMMSGGGVVKTSGTITATGADVTLDYSALDVSRTEPFIQGNLTIDNNTKLVLPGALAADTPYKLCSGTLAVGSTSLQKSITVGSNTFLADLTFDTSAKTVSYCPARTTTVSGGTTEWSNLTWANGTGTAGWASGANAHITVSAASTISVGSATTMNKLKLLGSADLTITGINNLTVDGFDLSEYTGSLTIDGALPAPVELHGGSLVFDIADGGASEADGESDVYQTSAISGTGDVYKRGFGSFAFGRTSGGTVVVNTYNGATDIESGMARRYGTAAFGAANNTVYIRSGSTVDLVTGVSNSTLYNFRLAGIGFGGYPALTAISGIVASSDGAETSLHGVNSIALDTDASIGGNNYLNLGYFAYTPSTTVSLNGHTLTKVGTGTFTANHFVFDGSGTMEVATGILASTVTFQGLNAKLKVSSGASCSVTFYDVYDTNFSWRDVENNGAITSSGAVNDVRVSNSYSGAGTINRLYLADGVTVKPTSNTSGLTVTGTMTLGGKVDIDISGIDLSAKADDTCFPVITAPLEFATSDVNTFTPGTNSSRWEIYAGKTATEGTYALGVHLVPVDATVTWSGDSGTWTGTSFNGGTDNFSNLSSQTAVFADNGESTTALEVSVSGTKTVNALNFTADNRNVTLSGDAITAATVSKSGDGVAIVNNALSGTTSISVTDGVLVLNPNGEAVADVDGLEAGTLVIYVGSGETRTVTESISATKIVKRGQGTLDLTAVSPSVPMVIDDGKVDVDEIPSANVTIGTDGVLALINDSANVQDANTDYSTITGSGILRLQSSSKWRMLSKNNFPTTVTLENELKDGLLLSESERTYEIGNLAGTKKIRSDYTNGDRHLRINQFGDTEWQGVFADADRIGTVYVRGGASATGTLTLSGEQAHNNSLTVESSGSVNLTGTWVGATTVSGTFGGTGTLAGDLTFNAGSTFKAYASDENGLSVTGSVSYPASGTVTVDVDALGSPESDVVLISKSGLDGDKFALKAGSPANYTLKVENNALKLKVLVSITVPAVENTTVTVTVGGDTIGTAAGSYYVLPGSEVTVTYAAASGYELSGTATYTIASATEDTTITITDTVAKPYVAQNGSVKFTTLAAAIANVATTSNPVVTLLANISEPEVTVSSTVMIMGGYTINADIKIADGGVLRSMATLNGKLTIEDGGAYATTGGTLSELVTKDGAIIELGMLSETTAPLSVTKLSVEGALTVRSSYGAATFGTTYKAISYVTANATIAQDAEFVGINQWESSVASEGANTIVSLTFTKIAVVDGVYYADAQDAVDAAVASGQPVSFLGAPGTVKIGIGETLIVSAGTQPTVALEDGLMNPPYDIAQTMDESYRNIYTVERYVAKLRNPNVGTTTYADEVKYTSLAAAVDDVVEQTMAIYADYVAIVTLLDDVTLDESVTVGKKMKLDLNGKTLTASGINAINNSTKLGIQGSSGSIAVTSGDSIVLTDAAATLTVSGGVTISPTPTTNVSRSRVVSSTVDGTTTYRVELIPGTIFSVY